MRNLHCLDCFDLEGRGRVYSVVSPIASPRQRSVYLAALGPVTIDGVPREIAGIEWHPRPSAVAVGEIIGLLVLKEPKP